MRLNMSDHRKADPRRFKAFTLVELLVVIGIIAVLIGILLPSLSVAREASRRAACAAKLHAIMIAAGIHAVDHKGYYPLAGQLNGSTVNGSSQPATMNDPYTEKYTWTGDPSLTANNGDYRLLAPMTLALGTEMGFKSNLNLSLANMLTANGLSRNFQCPSDATTDSDLYNRVCWLYAGYFGDYYGGFTDSISYVFNEGVCGFDDTTLHSGLVGYNRLKGLSTAVRQPAKTFFAADGLGGSTKTRLSGTWTGFNTPPNTPPQPWPSMTIWNNAMNAPITLSDAITARTLHGQIIAGDAANFDQIRHKGKMNIAFCDGHVELRDIPPFTLPPNSTVPVFKYDPNATALMNVFILAP